MIMGLTGAWAVSTYGFIGAALMPIPCVLLFFGGKLRARSVYNPTMDGGMMGQGPGLHKDEETMMQ